MLSDFETLAQRLNEAYDSFHRLSEGASRAEHLKAAIALSNAFNGFMTLPADSVRALQVKIIELGSWVENGWPVDEKITRPLVEDALKLLDLSDTTAMTDQ